MFYSQNSRLLSGLVDAWQGRRISFQDVQHRSSQEAKSIFFPYISYNWVFCDDKVWIVFMCDLVNGEGVAVRTGAARQEDVQSVIFISTEILLRCRDSASNQVN